MEAGFFWVAQQPPHLGQIALHDADASTDVEGFYGGEDVLVRAPRRSIRPCPEMKVAQVVEDATLCQAITTGGGQFGCPAIRLRCPLCLSATLESVGEVVETLGFLLGGSGFASDLYRLIVKCYSSLSLPLSVVAQSQVLQGRGFAPNVAQALHGFQGAVEIGRRAGQVGLIMENGQVVVVFGGVVLVADAFQDGQSLFQVFDGTQAVACGVLRGAGETMVAMVINLIGYWVLGLPTGLLLAFGVLPMLRRGHRRSG